MDMYSNIENPILLTMSENVGSALHHICGMMEYWNIGLLGLVE
jgi:hypothetical protein